MHVIINVKLNRNWNRKQVALECALHNFSTSGLLTTAVAISFNKQSDGAQFKAMCHSIALQSRICCMLFFSLGWIDCSTEKKSDGVYLVYVLYSKWFSWRMRQPHDYLVNYYVIQEYIRCVCALVCLYLHEKCVYLSIFTWFISDRFLLSSSLCIYLLILVIFTCSICSDEWWRALFFFAPIKIWALNEHGILMELSRTFVPKELQISIRI